MKNQTVYVIFKKGHLSTINTIWQSALETENFLNCGFKGGYCMKQIDFSTYYDKVLGGWLGKCIGGACGALSENNKDILHYTIDNVFPKIIPPNDDLDLQVLWLQEGLEKYGVGIGRKELGQLFAKYNICLANEYAVAIRNITLGILPPASGLFDNSYFLNSMGCPIRSEIWALVAPVLLKP